MGLKWTDWNLPFSLITISDGIIWLMWRVFYFSLVQSRDLNLDNNNKIVSMLMEGQSWNILFHCKWISEMILSTHIIFSQGSFYQTTVCLFFSHIPVNSQMIIIYFSFHTNTNPNIITLLHFKMHGLCICRYLQCHMKSLLASSALDLLIFWMLLCNWTLGENVQLIASAMQKVFSFRDISCLHVAW